MEGITVALGASIVALAALGTVALMLWRGSWLFLVAGKAAADEDAARQEACRTLGRRMAAVVLVACILMATLALFEAGKLTGSAPLATAATWANNAAFLALIVVLVWFFVVSRPERGDQRAEGDGKRSARIRSANLDHLHIATVLFVIALLAVVALVGILATL